MESNGVGRADIWVVLQYPEQARKLFVREPSVTLFLPIPLDPLGGVPSVDGAMVNRGLGVKTFPMFSKGAGERAPSNHPTAIWSSSIWTTLRYGKRVAGQTKA